MRKITTIVLSIFSLLITILGFLGMAGSAYLYFNQAIIYQIFPSEIQVPLSVKTDMDLMGNSIRNTANSLEDSSREIGSSARDFKNKYYACQQRDLIEQIFGGFGYIITGRGECYVADVFLDIGNSLQSASDSLGSAGSNLGSFSTSLSSMGNKLDTVTVPIDLSSVKLYVPYVIGYFFILHTVVFLTGTMLFFLSLKIKKY